MNFSQEILHIPEHNESLELNTKIYANPKNVYKTLTRKEDIAKVFAKFPEVNLSKFIYTWGWIDEGPTNLIYSAENEVIIYDFYLDFAPIGVVKWKIFNVNEEKLVCNLQLIFQDMILNNEFDPVDAYNSYRLGWLLLLYKIKDYTENKKFNLILV